MVADELRDAAELKISSQLVYLEARAALARASRAGRLAPRGMRRAVSELEDATGAMLLVGVDEALAREAGTLAEDHALRGYDAVHLVPRVARCRLVSDQTRAEEPPRPL
jgi:predicted nucleic acid-binding protein